MYIPKLFKFVPPPRDTIAVDASIIVDREARRILDQFAKEHIIIAPRQRAFLEGRPPRR